MGYKLYQRMEKLELTNGNYEELFEDVCREVERKSSHRFLASEEFKDWEGEDREYTALIVRNNKDRKLFITYCWGFAQEAGDRVKNKEKVYVSIDYEFNQRKIALMQINFERNGTSHMWALNPTELEGGDKKKMLAYLMTNQNIIKILHGADSLDMPYMFDHMFRGDKKTAVKFISRVIDTRFLCEFSMAVRDKEIRCNIYNSLVQHGVITEEKRDALIKIHDDMGPVQYISWNIYTMSESNILYAMYDVLFLKRFVERVTAVMEDEAPNHANALKLINKIYSFVITERRGVRNVIEFIKEKTNHMHNYMVSIRGQKWKLIDLYNRFMIGMKIDRPNLEMDNLMLISYFRPQLSALIKAIVYSVVATKWQIYSKRDNKYTMELKSYDIRHQIGRYEYLDLESMIGQIIETVEKLCDEME